MRCHLDVETVIRERKGLCLQLAQMGLSQVYILTPVARVCVCVCVCVQVHLYIFIVQILESFPSLSTRAWSLVSKERTAEEGKIGSSGNDEILGFSTKT